MYTYNNNFIYLNDLQKLVKFHGGQEFQKTYCYALRGVLNPKYFNLHDPEKRKEFDTYVNTLLSSNFGGQPHSKRKCKVNSMGIDKDDNWCKMQCCERMTDQDWGDMFSDIDKSTIVEKEWYAYPKFEWTKSSLQHQSVDELKQNLLSFQLDNHHLYYINVIENASSAQEVVVVGAKNIVNLIRSKTL
ncbi:prenylcysteine oxidase precursor [Reticulomyxa filosa]|uniref:Prenylcysteine oxidase n=1 Tax=Reticulomyxa filosa TaxID=46433 RepID=X6NI64_RETFI|nr:prenylcysteine oxidase precursor [Reticulomyxa filosa]|eukprot:ETO26010.1 prenylcysteine oxidase precursor [Reticulomyxa filosa]